MYMHPHHISFKHAWDGWITAFKTQPNFRVHLILSLTAIVLGYLLGISRIEWLIIFILISLGLALELINTAIEFTVDLLTDQTHMLAKFAKDTASGAVLIFACGAIIAACLIFLPKLWLFI